MKLTVTAMETHDKDESIAFSSPRLFWKLLELSSISMIEVMPWREDAVEVILKTMKRFSSHSRVVFNCSGVLRQLYSRTFRMKDGGMKKGLEDLETESETPSKIFKSVTGSSGQNQGCRCSKLLSSFDVIHDHCGSGGENHVILK